MFEVLDEESAREKAEFMYQFDGAMSVIQETEEPEDEMTRKNAMASSAVSSLKPSTGHTPLGHTGRTKVEQKAPKKLPDMRKASPKLATQVLA